MEAMEPSCAPLPQLADMKILAFAETAIWTCCMVLGCLSQAIGMRKLQMHVMWIQQSCMLGDYHSH